LSAIYGIVRLDGRPVGDAELAVMRAPMAYWGPDGGGVWREGCGGLGRLVSHDTPEAVHEAGPVVVADGTIVVSAAGRIDNRDELCVALGIPSPERPSTPDGRLIALAYGRWGEEAPRRLLGDWGFAAWHPRERRLVVARDHYGHTALYWHRSAQQLAFASSLKGLLALPGIPRRLDELRLAETLAICAARGAPTLYEGIERLPTARILTFDERGVRTREYWSLLDVPELRLASDEAYAERATELLDAAVRARLRTSATVATTLSAGLDSTAVTVSAARALGDAPLAAYTGRPAHPEVATEMPGLLVDEWPLAHAVAVQHANIEHLEVRGEEVTPLASLDRSLAMHEEVEHATPNLPWVTSMLDRAAGAGAGVLLTGQMGNGSVSWPGESRRVLDHIAARDLAGTRRTLRDARAAGRHGWAGAVWRGILLPLRRLAEAERMRRDPRRQAGFASGLMNPAFAARIGIVDHVRATGWEPQLARCSARERRLVCLLPGRLPVGGWWHQRSAAHGIDVRDPTSDVALLEFCVGTPDDQFARDGRDRWLMRRMLDGRAPAEVTWGHRRGAQGADIAYRLRADAPSFSAAVEELAGDDAVREYLDVDAIARHWRSVLAGRSEGALEVTRGVLLGRFVRRVTGQQGM
jgi:asparagine synthase (glutamine-hydrolysing)